jgi:putative nucleotidyltransferase with HDIG domain
MENASALVMEAEKALYIAKRGGCNRVIHFDEINHLTLFPTHWAASRSRTPSSVTGSSSSDASGSPMSAVVDASALSISKKELARAYDSTIEGWSRVLDMRDKEAEGHSLRVTEMTIHLAETMGIRGQELVYMRWGALLHDIGKMGVPDSILLKAGPLTPEEWEVMRSHTTLAYEMLSSIAFMHPALDIPFSHHERWDGTGYPQGLKGEEIPLAARIFAIVDMWDALRSDRPYRTAWSEREALDHIYSLSGKHFDPQVVQAFHRLTQNGSIECQVV